MFSHLNIEICNAKSVTICDIRKWEEKDCCKGTGVQKKKPEREYTIGSYCTNVSSPPQFRQRSEQLPKLLEGDMTHGHNKIMAARDN